MMITWNRYTVLFALLVLFLATGFLQVDRQSLGIEAETDVSHSHLDHVGPERSG